MCFCSTSLAPGAWDVGSLHQAVSLQYQANKTQILENTCNSQCWTNVVCYTAKRKGRNTRKEKRKVNTNIIGVFWYSNVPLHRPLIIIESFHHNINLVFLFIGVIQQERMWIYFSSIYGLLNSRQWLTDIKNCNVIFSCYTYTLALSGAAL